MTEYMHLVGAEQVQNAARQMQSAAEETGKAAGSIAYSLEMHHRFMDDWLQRFEAALEKHSKETYGGI